MILGSLQSTVGFYVFSLDSRQHEITKRLLKHYFKLDRSCTDIIEVQIV